MKRKPIAISPDDAALFRDAIGPVRPLPESAPAPRQRPPTPEPRMQARDEADALRESRAPGSVAASIDASEALAYRRPELPERVFKSLKRGQFSVRDEIDLHPLRAAEAEALLKRFLNQTRQEAKGCVRVIHGKGLHSEGTTSVLKAMVDRVLRHRGDVLAFASAPTAQGGTGAVLVLLAER